MSSSATQQQQNQQIKPFTLAIPDSKIEALKQRLELTNLPEQLDNEDLWEIGVPLSEVRRLIARWKGGFDWRAAERRINELEQYRTGIEVDGFGEVGLHFVHHRSEVKGAIPLLFVHGWPGSFLEVTKILPLLLNGGDGAPSFHVVAPSLPNFGFSDGITKRGFNMDQYGEVGHKLMLKLGYDKYVTQGGDWGYAICRSIAIQFPENNVASHLNVSPAPPPSLWSAPLLWLQNIFSPFSDYEKRGLARTKYITDHGMAYNREQSTKPQTIGYSLQDSPVGLLAWIYEKFHAWSDKYPWTDDEILTWVSLYWFSTPGPAASVRIYYEATHPTPGTKATRERTRDTYVPHVKLAISSFHQDLTVVPKNWTRGLGDLIFHREHENGGHFAAYEVPDVLVKDLRESFGSNDVRSKF